MGGFDPFTQNVTLLGPGGGFLTNISLADVDLNTKEFVSAGINYGSQIGACILMLTVILVMTPTAKLRRPSNLLHISALVVCIMRVVFAVIFYVSPWIAFYAYYGGDFSHVKTTQYHLSILGNVFSLVLVIIIELALMHQAWAMVVLWPATAKWSLAALSAIITLLTVTFRIAFTVIQCEATLNLVAPEKWFWLVQASLITNLLSIAWFCALFNMKLVVHLAINRGFLPATGSITPMEVLVMTNGILMIVPVVFGGLEWANITRFESASLTLTSVAIILPLGTLAARRMAKSSNVLCDSSGSGHRCCQCHGSSNAPSFPHGVFGGHHSTTQLKSSVTNSSHTGTTQHTALYSRCEAGPSHRDASRDADVEMGTYATRHDGKAAQVRVDRELHQREERV